VSGGTLKFKKVKSPHWSRQPEQIKRDRRTLAVLGLSFTQTCGTFYSLKKIQEVDVNNNYDSAVPHSLDFASKVKAWAIDRMMEYFFDGQRTNQHKLAVAFWKKSGRRLLND